MLIPDPLHAGAAVAVVAPASFVDRDLIEKGLRIVETWGFTVRRGRSLYGRAGQFAGTDEQRLDDLQWALDNRDVGAVLMARGGYGISRLIDHLDFTAFCREPKWLVGFSDITALHAHVHNLNIASIHGPMPGYYARPDARPYIGRLRELLSGIYRPTVVPAREANRTGQSRGLLVGGNLSIFCHLIGTDSDIDTAGKVLLLEDVGEYRYNIDRMFVQLKRSGKLRDLAGLLIGRFNELKEPRNPFGGTLQDIVNDHTAGYSYPVAFGFPAGHHSENQPIVFGKEVLLQVDDRQTILQYVTAQNLQEDLPV